MIVKKVNGNGRTFTINSSTDSATYNISSPQPQPQPQPQSLNSYTISVVPTTKQQPKHRGTIDLTDEDTATASTGGSTSSNTTAGKPTLSVPLKTPPTTSNNGQVYVKNNGKVVGSAGGAAGNNVPVRMHRVGPDLGRLITIPQSRNVLIRIIGKHISVVIDLTAFKSGIWSGAGALNP